MLLTPAALCTWQQSAKTAIPTTIAPKNSAPNHIQGMRKTTLHEYAAMPSSLSATNSRDIKRRSRKLPIVLSRRGLKADTTKVSAQATLEGKTPHTPGDSMHPNNCVVASRARKQLSLQSIAQHDHTMDLLHCSSLFAHIYMLANTSLLAWSHDAEPLLYLACWQPLHICRFRISRS